MKHRLQNKRFSRSPEARKALINGLVCSLVEHERIRTTLSKAKELRRHVERAVTLGRGESDVHATRLLISRYCNKDTVFKIVHDLSVRFKDRPGGYTRILKLGPRVGDGSPMAFIEFVDFDPVKNKADKKFKIKTKDSKGKQIVKEMTLEEKEQYKKIQKIKNSSTKKKNLRKIKNQSRKVNRHAK